MRYSHVISTDPNTTEKVLTILKTLFPKFEFKIYAESKYPRITAKNGYYIFLFLNTIRPKGNYQDDFILSIPIKELLSLKYLYERNEKLC